LFWRKFVVIPQELAEAVCCTLFFLNCGLKQSVHTAVKFTNLIMVDDLVLFEAWDKGPMVSLEDEFGYEFAQTLHLQQLDNVYLSVKSLKCILVPLSFVSSPSEAIPVLKAAATAEARPDQVLQVIVNVLATISH